MHHIKYIVFLFLISCQHPGVLFEQAMPNQAASQFTFPSPLQGHWSAVSPDTTYHPDYPMRIMRLEKNLIIVSQLMIIQTRTWSEGPTAFLDTVDGGKFKNRSLLNEELKDIGGKVEFYQNHFSFSTELNDTLFSIDSVNHIRKSDAHWILNRRDIKNDAWILGWITQYNDTLDFMYPTRSDSARITSYLKPENILYGENGMIRLRLSDKDFKSLLDLNWDNRRSFVRVK